MGVKNFKKGDKEFSFFGNFWAFAQAYWVPEKSDEYRNGLLRDSQKLWEHFCADGMKKPLPDISSRRMSDLIYAFANSEEHNFLNDFVHYTDKFSYASTDDEWEEFVKEAQVLFDRYCYDESWPCRKRGKMISDFLYNVNSERERRRKEESGNV